MMAGEVGEVVVDGNQSPNCWVRAVREESVAVAAGIPHHIESQSAEAVESLAVQENLLVEAAEN